MDSVCISTGSSIIPDKRGGCGCDHKCFTDILRIINKSHYTDQTLTLINRFGHATETVRLNKEEGKKGQSFVASFVILIGFKSFHRFPLTGSGV